MKSSILALALLSSFASAEIIESKEINFLEVSNSHYRLLRPSDGGPGKKIPEMPATNKKCNSGGKAGSACYLKADYGYKGG